MVPLPLAAALYAALFEDTISYSHDWFRCATVYSTVERHLRQSPPRLWERLVSLNFEALKLRPCQGSCRSHPCFCHDQSCSPDVKPFLGTNPVAPQLVGDTYRSGVTGLLLCHQLSGWNSHL
ncbi:hypothetical protein F5888DRAFT_1206185 [Russula emetica]|nr:hypothetical protein F5888DRAFT_1206185 [Russula emetica]